MARFSKNHPSEIKVSLCSQSPHKVPQYEALFHILYFEQKMLKCNNNLIIIPGGYDMLVINVDFHKQGFKNYLK